MAIPALCDIGFQNFTLVIDRSPEIVRHAVYLHENFVQMPLQLCPRTHPVSALSPYLGSEHRPEPVPPEPEHLVTEIDTALVQLVVDVPK